MQHIVFHIYLLLEEEAEAEDLLVAVVVQVDYLYQQPL
jgi:hypothetical protein